jgi:hypothetical protein
MNAQNAQNTNEQFAITPAAPQHEIVDGAEMLVDLTTAQTSYCSLTPETDEQRKSLYNAVNAPAHRLSEYIGKQITVSDVYVEVVQMTDERTGEVTQAPRIVLFDQGGESWACVSTGVFGSLKKLFAIFGTPDAWNAPLTLEVRQIERGNGKRLLTLAAV